MEVILKKNVANLGNKYDLVTVKPGYGRNYLIPRQLADQATPGNKKVWIETVKQRQHKVAKQLDESQSLAKVLESLELTIYTKASSTGSIYGAITPTQVSEAIQAQGHALLPKAVSFDAPIKQLGTHQARLRLHKDVEQVITLQVLEEE